MSKLSNLGQEIYRKSADIIDSLLKDNANFNNLYSEAEKKIVKRIIHATSDINYADSVYFTGGSVQKAANLIRERTKANRPLKIVCDSQMTKAGISKNINKTAVLDISCYIGFNYDVLLENWNSLTFKHKFLEDFGDIDGHVKHPDLTNITRSAFSIRLATIEKLPDIIVIGNAPTALMEIISLCKRLYRFMEYSPCVIVAMPVGFVGAAESKKILFEDNFYSAIGNFGNLGGSSSAASAVNALLFESL